ncbi:MAG: calcineurin-like phosphoesterase family protein [Armatimonadaceae bacterium]
MNTNLQRCAALALAVVAGSLLAAIQRPTPTEAVGVVYHDKNKNQRRDPGEEGIANVRVSNGREITKTDRDGRWKLSVSDDTALFVIKPRNWMTPVNQDNLPQFYYIHKPNGSPKTRYPGVSPTGPLPASVDFGLYPQKELNTFDMVLFGDTQPRNQAEVEFIAHDVVERLIGVNAAFGMTLGDVVFDDMSLYPSLNRTIGMIGIPWYNVLGNHDMNYDAPDDTLSDETWERTFGPSYYSFDWGPVHFVALDDVIWTGPRGDQRGRYTAGLGEKQLEWLKRDLEMVPKNQLVVLGMHIPIQSMAEKEEVFRLLEQRPFALSLSAHTHFQEHTFLTEKDGWKGKTPHHHVIHATVCGSWWSGSPDERGIPHATMSDGGPNGHSIVTFDGTKYRMRFVPASRPEGEQIRIWTPEMVPQAELENTEVVANVYFGSEKSTVEMRMDDGEWKPMVREARKDPYFEKLKQLETGENPPPGRRLPGAHTSQHMWKAALPASLSRGHHKITVRTTDMWGQKYSAERIFQVQ